jgi:transcriptional regulator with XRE-family HTH domain
VSIGEELAQARGQAGLSVAQVSQRTRIRQTIIRGIESDDYSVCGGDFYARGHIRSIAKTVGADPELLIREYDTAHRAPAVLSATAIDELVTLSAAAGRRPLNVKWKWSWGWAMAVAGLALALAAGLAGYHLVTAAGPAAGSAAGAARMVTSPGQGDNPQTAPPAIDGSPPTAWRTDWYTTAQFGNLYAGTGLLLDMGRPVTVTAARVTLGSAPGAGLQLRVGAAPVLADLPPVAHAADAGGVVRLQPASPAHGRYVLLWFTMLPPDPGGTFQASVYDVRLEGRP